MYNKTKIFFCFLLIAMLTACNTKENPSDDTSAVEIHTAGATEILAETSAEIPAEMPTTEPIDVPTKTPMEVPIIEPTPEPTATPQATPTEVPVSSENGEGGRND